MEITELYKLFLKYPSIQTDSRKINGGDFFFALKGPNFNGNDFAFEVLQAGAAYSVVDEDIVQEDSRIIQVPDVLKCLQQLAGYHRSQFLGVPFIAITGSNGKTTTKELVNSVLQTTFITYTTEGNLNNHIGIPLTLLKIRRDAEVCVIEMGANHAKEIEGYCTYVKPTHGLITNIGKAHLEGFGDLEGVRRAKGELFDYLRLSGGTVIVNADDPKLIKMAEGMREVISYGVTAGMHRGEPIQNDPFLSLRAAGELKTIHTKLSGSYNLYNVMAAIAIGKFLRVPDDKIAFAIEHYVPSNSRSQLIMKGSNTIIMDCYNANPSSMKYAIENIALMDSENKILLLGSMMELGAVSGIEHSEILNLIDKYNWKDVILVGNGFRELQNPYTNFDDVGQARDFFQKQDFQNSTILIKGSRSMQMEKVIED